MKNKYSLWILANLLIISAIWLTACGGGTPAEEPTAAPAATEAKSIYDIIEKRYPYCQFENDYSIICSINDVEVYLPRVNDSDPYLVAVALPMESD